MRNEVNFPLAGLHSQVIKRRAIRWIGGGWGMVQKSALVIVCVLRLGSPGEELAGELEHVVGVAGFLREIGKLGGEHVGRRAEMFAGAVAAGDVAAMQRDLLPEKLRRIAVMWVTGEFEFARGADELGDLGIGVEG